MKTESIDGTLHVSGLITLETPLLPPEPLGSVAVWSSSFHPYLYRDHLAHPLQTPNQLGIWYFSAQSILLPNHVSSTSKGHHSDGTRACFQGNLHFQGLQGSCSLVTNLQMARPEAAIPKPITTLPDKHQDLTDVFDKKKECRHPAAPHVLQQPCKTIVSGQGVPTDCLYYIRAEAVDLTGFPAGKPDHLLLWSRPLSSL